MKVQADAEKTSEPTSEKLQADILSIATLSYADRQRLKAGEFQAILAKLRARSLVYNGLIGCLLTLMLWAFRGEPIGMVMAVTFLTILVIRLVLRLRALAYLERQADLMAGVDGEAPLP